MKNLKNYFIAMACCLAATATLTSCLGDDDNSSGSINTTDLANAVSNMKGVYTGKCYTLYNASVRDTTTISYTASDSIVVENFPLKPIAMSLNNSNAELAQALLEKGTTHMAGYYGFYGSVANFFVMPNPLNVKVTYGGQLHNVTIYFDNPSTGTSYNGIYNDGTLSFSETVSGIKVDNTTLTNAMADSYFSFTSCNSNDANDGLNSNYTKVDKTTVISVLCGNYEGKLYYSSENSVFKQDSTDAKWTVYADTTITYTFPVKLLANFCIKTSTQGVADKALVAAASDQNLTASMNIPGTMLKAYYEQGDYFAGLSPKNSLTETASDGTKITVEFTTDDIKDAVTGSDVYSMLEYYKQKEKAVFLVKDVKVGDNTYTVNCPFWLFGNKKSSIIKQ